MQISVGSSCPDYTDAFIVVSENESVLCVERLRAVSDVVLEGRMSHRHTILTPLHSFPIDGLHRFHRVTSQVPSKKKSTRLGSSQLYVLYHKLHASKMIKKIKIICILIICYRFLCLDNGSSMQKHLIHVHCTSILCQVQQSMCTPDPVLLIYVFLLPNCYLKVINMKLYRMSL